MNEVTIVTAFWNIGRKDFNLYPRTNEQYLEYFKFWAKIQNKLIVYTYKEMAEEVKKIREENGLLDKTIIIEINDETTIEPTLYKQMDDISKQNYINEYRYTKGVLENNAKYNYVMLMKYWCMADAVKRGLATTQLVAWMDFGFNHGSDCYTNSEEFAFEWKSDLCADKIHLFNIYELDELPIFEVVRNMDVNIMGDLVISGRELCKDLWELTREAMQSLVNVGFIDDDQVLLLMSYRRNKEKFELHKSTWFMPLKENGAAHLTTKPVSMAENRNKTISEKMYALKRRAAYIKRQYKYFK